MLICLNQFYFTYLQSWNQGESFQCDPGMRPRDVTKPKGASTLGGKNAYIRIHAIPGHFLEEIWRLENGVISWNSYCWWK